MKCIYIIFTTLTLCLIFIISQQHGTSADPVKGGVPSNDNNNQKPAEVEDIAKTTIAPHKSTPSNTNKTQYVTDESRLSSITDPDTMKRMLYVLLGFTSLVVVFFVFKTVRARTRRKTKKYGVLATPAADVELTPLDQEEDDEDMTVFDANSK